MKYIDADKLKAEIRRRIDWLNTATGDFAEGRRAEMHSLYDFIDSHQQEQPEPPKIEIAEYYYHKGIYEGLSQGRADALKILEEFMKRKAEPVIVIKQQEQQEMDLEGDAVQFCFDKGLNVTPYQAKTIASHFYELGQSVMRERIANPKYNQMILEKMKYEHPIDEVNTRKEE